MRYDVALQVGETIRWRCLVEEECVDPEYGITVEKWYEAKVLTTFSTALTLTITNDNGKEQPVPHYKDGHFAGYTEIELIDKNLPLERMRTHYLAEIAKANDRHKTEVDALEAKIEALYR